MKFNSIIQILIILLCNVEDIKAGNENDVHSFGVGTFEMDSIILNKPHALLEGKGRGITILKIKNGILATAPDPIIRDLTIIGEGKNTGITLKNTWTANLDNIEIENYDTGMKIILDDEGHITAGKKTHKKWPGALTEGEHWGSRITLTDIKNIEIVGDGDGIILENRLPKGNKGTRGQFFTATTLWGGHIYVKNHALVIGDNVANTKLIGTYIDVRSSGMIKNHAIVMNKNAWRLTLIGVDIDLNSKKKKYTGAEKIVAKSRKAVKSVSLISTNVDKNEIIYMSE